LTLHHVVEGEGPPLVLAGSLGTTLELWEPQLPALARRYRVVRYDHPGHGRSPLGVASLEGIARETLALLDELGIERASFCGLSVGGMVGVWLAAHRPERIERLVLACTAPRFPPPELWVERAAAVRAGGVEAIADVIVGRWFTKRFRNEQPESVRRYRRMLVETPPEGYARCCDAIREADLRADVARIEAPTTVVLGAHDPAVSAEGAAALRAIRGARVVELDAAHLANVEQPDAFAEAVLG
jgi:3-oxoadipate enol-lactonase